MKSELTIIGIRNTLFPQVRLTTLDRNWDVSHSEFERLVEFMLMVLFLMDTGAEWLPERFMITKDFSVGRDGDKLLVSFEQIGDRDITEMDFVEFTIHDGIAFCVRAQNVLEEMSSETSGEN